MNETVAIEDLRRRSRRRRVICGCMFHRELAALDWRLHELDGVVDDFVIVEAVRTHSGAPREIVRPERDQRFAHMSGRLHGVVIDDPPDGPDPWVRERSQREAIWAHGAAAVSGSDDDLVIISDVDDVPFPDVVDRLAYSDFDTPLYARSHWFNFDWSTYLGAWEHASICFYPAGLLRQLYDAGRGDEVGRSGVPGRELEGLNGWHASWFGSDDVILDKLSCYAHARDDKDRLAIAEGVEGIRRRRRSGRDMFGLREKLAELPRLPAHAHRLPREDPV